MEEADPFTGTWVYVREKSSSTGPTLERWIQHIDATAEILRVREEVIVATGQRANVSLEAKFDGYDYPVTGSSLCESIAYTRPTPRQIFGKGKKNGGVTVRETIFASDDGLTLTLTYAVFASEREIMSGVAVFQRGSS
jgi:hypothetical protein